MGKKKKTQFLILILETLLNFQVGIATTITKKTTQAFFQAHNIGILLLFSFSFLK